jgi:hypothetical protein
MEAIDLGCAMARTWWRPVLAAWLPLYLGATVLVHLAFYGNATAAILVLWWLKPLFDRAALDVLGRAVFGEHPGVRDVLKAVWKSPGILASLTFYRFDLARSFNLPIWHLERLRGAAASRRAKALHGRSRRYAVWATIVFLHFEAIITLSLWGAIDLFTPEPYGGGFGLQSVFVHDKALWQQWLGSLFYAAAVTLVEPFYVGAGFALYLNRRTQLEAWDVELALRRYARRARAAPVAVLVALIVVLGAVQPGVSHAADLESPASAIKQILAAPEFDQYEEVKRLQYVGRDWGGDLSGGRGDGGAKVSPLVGEIARLLTWIAVGVLIACAVYYLRRIVPAWSAVPRKKRAVLPSAIFGLEIAPESLPADVAAAALAAIEEGNVRGGLSLLYRGALSVLVHGNALEVAAGDTEGDCVRRVAAQTDAEKARFFSELVAAWQITAYAERLPDADALRALCREWPVHFGGTQ